MARKTDADEIREASAFPVRRNAPAGDLARFVTRCLTPRHPADPLRTLRGEVTTSVETARTLGASFPAGTSCEAPLAVAEYAHGGNPRDWPYPLLV